MTLWDVFYSERLEAGKGLTTAEVRARLKAGDLGDADLIRPSGTGVPWARMTDWPALLQAAGDAEQADCKALLGGCGGVFDATGESRGNCGVEDSATTTRASADVRPTLQSSCDAERISSPLPEETTLAAEPSESWVEPLPQSGTQDQVTGALTPISSEADAGFAPPSHDHIETAEEPLDAIIIDDDDDDDDEEHAAETGMLDAIIIDDDDEEDLGEFDLNLRTDESAIALPAVASGKELWADFDDEDGVDEFDPEAEDEAAAEFSLARSSTEKVEELDLAAMVDVAFQLVLFFLVTATTVLYKTLEVPKPNPEAPPNAAVQGAQSIEDLQDTYILVDIDASGNFRIDREPAPNTMKGLAERLRAARAATQRTAMLLTADFSTQHQYAVTAYDAANEIGLRIAIARPVPRPGE